LFILLKAANSTKSANEQSFKVFRYSFSGTIPNFLNRLPDNLLPVRSKWNLQNLLVLDWTLAWFTFCENRYFHDNDKQKSSKAKHSSVIFTFRCNLQCNKEQRNLNQIKSRSNELRITLNILAFTWQLWICNASFFAGSYVLFNVKPKSVPVNQC